MVVVVEMVVVVMGVVMVVVLTSREGNRGGDCLSSIIPVSLVSGSF